MYTKILFPIGTLITYEQEIFFVYFGCYEILRLASVDLHFQNLLLSILKKLLIVGSSAPARLDFAIMIFRTNT